MTAVSVGSVLRARATFRDAGKLFDPPMVVAEVSWAGGSRRMSTASGDVIRESIGVFAALVPVGAGPTVTVVFSDGRDLKTMQVLQVVAPNVTIAPTPINMAEEARAKARASNAAAEEAARARQAEIDDLRMVEIVRAKARASAQAERDADEIAAEEKRRRDAELLDWRGLLAKRK